MKTTTIYALFVGINNYPNPRHRLRGCLEDVKQMHQFLDTFCKKNNIIFNNKVLKDDEATREGIIKGFEHFSTATNEDICLFFYAGHGSRAKAPREFLHLETDRHIETLVCYDSRTEGGRDLMDKELSWLIWKVTKDHPQLQFISIMDCCHSGKVTRSQHIEKEEVVARTADARKDKFKANTLLGFSDYQSVGDGRYNPPVGRQILLAAARDKEEANEASTRKGKRGMFTYCLLELLESTDRLTYSEINNRVNVRIKIALRNIPQNQSSQIMSKLPMDKEQYFLTKELKSTQKTYFVYWNSENRKWCVNAGRMQGVMIGSENKLPQFEFLEGKETIKSIEVSTNYTIIRGLERLNKVKSYPVRQHKQVRTLIETKDSNLSIIQDIKKTIEQRDNFSFKWAENSQVANFEISASENSLTFKVLTLTKEQNTYPIFPTIEGRDPKSIQLFLDAIEKYTRWIDFLQLKNPDTAINEENVEVNLYKVNKEAPKDNRTEKLTTNEVVELFDLGSQSSTFQLSIKNNSEQNLWVSICYFDADYSIQNHLVDIQELEKGEEVWAFSVDKDGQRTQDIPVVFPKICLSNTKSVNTYLKIFICREEFNTDNLNQKGVTIKSGAQRSESNQFVTHSDWTTKEIHLNIKSI